MTQFNAEELAFNYMCETETPRALTPTDKDNLNNLSGKLNQAYTAGYNKAIEDAVEHVADHGVILNDGLDGDQERRKRVAKVYAQELRKLSKDNASISKLKKG